MLTEYAYSCFDPLGQETKGVISATDRMMALSKLREQGLTVIDLVEKKAKAQRRVVWGKGIKDQDLYNISKELSILLRSGIRIDKALELVMNPAMKQELKEVLSLVLSDLKSGKEVAQAFAQTNRFSPLFVNIIQVAEAVGNLSSGFENIAQYYRFQIQLKEEIRNALTYPVFLIFASLITLFVIFNFVVPRFFSIFGTDMSTLPLMARVLHALASWLSAAHLLIFFGVLILGLFIWRRFHPLKGIGSTLSAPLLSLPVVGKLLLNLELSRFSYSMFSMLQSGIEFIKALKLSAALLQNPRLRFPVESLVEQIKGGRKIADTFSQVPFFPEIVPNMLRVGEGSGNLKDIFFELYQVFDERFKNRTKRMLVLLEPTIIVIMGLFVGFIVISLILTVMSVGSIKL